MRLTGEIYDSGLEGEIRAVHISQIDQSVRQGTNCVLYYIVLWCCSVLSNLFYERKHETAERTKDVLFVQRGETGRGGGVRQ